MTEKVKNEKCAIIFEYTCNSCYKLAGKSSRKDMPKSFVCPHCNVGQTVTQSSYPGRTIGRVYQYDFYN